MNDSQSLDALIVGGGPAGLSAALILGRCLRHVVVCDSNHPRNERSPALHGFLGSDGIPPLEFLRRSRAQLERYETVRYVTTTIVDVEHGKAGFITRDAAGKEWRSRALLIATGLVDRLPAVPGIEDFMGTSVHHCPYCDGWENRGKRLGVIGSDPDAVGLGIELLRWSGDVTIYTNGGKQDLAADPARKPPLEFVTEKISALEGGGGKLVSILLENGGRRDCDSLFFFPSQYLHSDLALKLGCQIEGEALACGPSGETMTDGLFLAGNATVGVQMALLAAAEGLKAGVAINNWLETRYDSALAGASASH
jgi:thioredoxin reductase